jgi:predicted RNase H-like nuclease
MKHKIDGYHLSVFHVSRNYLLRTYGQIRGETLLKMIIKSIPGSIVAPSPIMNKSTVIETFPTAIVCGLFPEIYPVKYKIKPKVPYKNTQRNMALLLNQFRQIEEKDNTIHGITESAIMKSGLNKKNHKHIEDQVDAFLCAYGLYCIYKEHASALTYGCIHDGFITVPEVKK